MGATKDPKAKILGVANCVARMRRTRRSESGAKLTEALIEAAERVVGTKLKLGTDIRVVAPNPDQIAEGVTYVSAALASVRVTRIEDAPDTKTGRDIRDGRAKRGRGITKKAKERRAPWLKRATEIRQTSNRVRSNSEIARQMEDEGLGPFDKIRKAIALPKK